jgi:transcriptional regulator with XRE-family HTH domain
MSPKARQGDIMGHPSRAALQIKAFRNMTGWSQTELAEKAKLSRSAIRDLEVGNRKTPSMATIKLLSDVFSVRLKMSSDYIARSIIFGSSDPPVRHFGFISSGDEITITTENALMTTNFVPPGLVYGDWCGIDIATSELTAKYQTGSQLFFRFDRKTKVREIDGHDCVVKCYGKYYLKRIERELTDKSLGGYGDIEYRWMLKNVANPYDEQRNKRIEFARKIECIWLGLHDSNIVPHEDRNEAISDEEFYRILNKNEHLPKF